MRTSNRLFKFTDRWLGGAAVLAAWALHRMLGAQPGKRSAQPRKILFSKFCCQGDALVSLHALALARTHFPQTRFVLLASRKTEEVFQASRLFDQIIRINISGQNGIFELGGSGLLRSVLDLRRQGPFDVYIDMDLYYRFSLLTGLFLGAPARIGFRTSWIRSIAFTASVPRHRTQSEMECYFELLSLLGLPRQESRPRFSIPKACSRETKLWLRNQGWDGKAPLIAIMPGSSPNWPAKRWPAVRYGELMGRLAEGKPVWFLVLGSEFEKGLGLFLRDKHPRNAIDLTGQTDFTRLAESLSLCTAFIGNDSGPMHLADMLGIPVIAIFGPTDERKWGPLNGVSVVVSSQSVDCRPCYYLSRMPDCKHLRCLSTISVDQVLDACGRFLPLEPEGPRGQGE